MLSVILGDAFLTFKQAVVNGVIRFGFGDRQFDLFVPARCLYSTRPAGSRAQVFRARTNKETDDNQVSLGKIKILAF